MKRLLSGILIFCSMHTYAAEQKEACSHWMSLLKPICQRLKQIWTDGDTEAYFSGYAWHNRYIYSPEKIRKYNENAWGGGLGKGLFDEKGNWHGLYAIAFLDSHSDIEPVVGYAHLWVSSLTDNLKAGIGYSILVTARSDINNYMPFPGAVPWAAVFYKKVTVAASYVPGNSSNGNVLFIVGKYTF